MRTQYTLHLYYDHRIVVHATAASRCSNGSGCSRSHDTHTDSFVFTNGCRDSRVWDAWKRGRSGVLYYSKVCGRVGFMFVFCVSVNDDNPTTWNNHIKRAGVCTNGHICREFKECFWVE